MASQRRWTIDRATGFQCGGEDYIFLSRMRDGADNEDEGLRQWLSGQMKLYWTMELEYMDHGWESEEEDDEYYLEEYDG
jgi:hypothetical protein